MAYRPLGVTQTVTVSGTTAASTALNAQCRVVQLVSTENCYVLPGSGTPTATAVNGMFILKDWPHYINVSGGEKIAAIQVSTGGTLYVSELTQ
jgi:hypothetical protein